MGCPKNLQIFSDLISCSICLRSLHGVVMFSSSTLFHCMCLFCCWCRDTAGESTLVSSVHCKVILKYLKHEIQNYCTDVFCIKWVLSNCISDWVVSIWLLIIGSYFLQHGNKELKHTHTFKISYILLLINFFPF